MNRYKTLAANTVILGLGQFGSKVLVILMMGFYQAALGTNGYGEINTIIDTATLLMSLATLSVGESLIRFGIDKAYDNKQVFSIGFRVTLCGVVCCMVFVPLTGLFTNIFPENSVLKLLDEYAWLTVLYVCTGSFKSCCALFVRSIGHVRLYAIDGILTTVMNILFNVVLLFGLKLGNIGYLMSVVLADICSVIFLTVLAKLYRYLSLFRLDKGLMRSMLHFCIPMIPTSLMWWIINVSDRYMISGMISFDAGGIYKAASNFPSMISIFSGIFSQAWNMSAITENNSGTIARFYTNVFNIFQSTVYVIAGALFVAIKPLVLIFCDEAFYVAYLSTPFIIMSVVFTCFSTFMGSVYVASKQSMHSLATATVGAVLNIALNILFINLWGIDGAALASFISFAVIFAVRAADTHHIIRMDLNLPKMIVNCALLMLMGVVIFTIQDVRLYYPLLALLFIIILGLNFRAGVQAIKMITKKNIAE